MYTAQTATRTTAARESGNLCVMDAATVRAMLEQHFTSSDPDVAHEMYRADAVLSSSRNPASASSG